MKIILHKFQVRFVHMSEGLRRNTKPVIICVPAKMCTPKPPNQPQALPLEPAYLVKNL